MQGRNGDTDVENGLKDTVGEGEGGAYAERSINIYTLSCVKQLPSRELRYNREPSLVLCWQPRGVKCGEEALQGGGIYIIMAEPHCCMAETTTTW